MLVQEAKQEMMLELGVGEGLEKVTISLGDYHNPDVFHFVDGHEFVYHGDKYDFSAQEKTEEGFQFAAVKDIKESLLDDLLASQFDNRADKQSKTPFKKLIKNFAKEFLPNEKSLPKGIFNTHKFDAIQVCSNILDGHRLVSFPPPDSAS